jgi:hypothetical protein
LDAFGNTAIPDWQVVSNDNRIFMAYRYWRMGEAIVSIQHIPEQTKHIGDALSVFTVLGALMSWLPAVAALFTIIWTGIRIWETKTIQKWVNKPKGD